MSPQEPSLIIVPERRRAGRPTRAATASTERIEFVVTAEERSELKQMAFESGKPLATVIREAVNEYVSDYGERQVFRRR